MRSVRMRVAPCGSARKASTRSPGSNGRPYSAVILDRNIGRRSKFSPTGTIATRRPAAAAASAMRAAPVLRGSRRPLTWLMPSGKRQMASPSARARSTAANVSALRAVSTPGSMRR